jgi:prepilin peptidase CpaA
MFTGSPSQVAWGALFTALLCAGCITDVRTRRIPNPLVLVILASGVVYAILSRPVVPGLTSSLLGIALGFAIWIGFHVVGVIGAGDVKFFAAAGAWLGPSATWRAAVLAAAVGGVLAVVFLVREGRLMKALRSIALAGVIKSTTGVAELPDGAPRGQRLPYGVALACGALLAAWVPSLLR